MGISTVPDSTAGLKLRQTITTSGWYDLGDPKPITVIIAGGGGGGGGVQSGSLSGGAGGGGGAGAMFCKMFIGGRVYIAIGAGGIAGVGTSTAGQGGNSLFIYPMGRQERGSTIPTVAIKVGGGGYGGYGAQSIGQLGGDGFPGVSGGTGISLTGYSITTAIGDSGSNGASGASQTGPATNPSAYASFYPNIIQSRMVSLVPGWRPNNLARFNGATTSSIDFTFASQTDTFLASDPDSAMPFLDESGSSYAVPKSYFTSGTIAFAGVSTGGSPGAPGGSTQAAGGASGYLTGGGAGGPAQQNGGSGGSSVMYRGGLGGFTLNVTNVGGGGGAGIAGPGANGVTAVGSAGGFGGAGGLGGGGGGGGQGGAANGSNGGKGGDGACLIYW